MAIELIITPAEDNKKLLDILKGRGFSRRLITRLKRTENGITRNGEHIRTIDRVFCGNIITVSEHDEVFLEANGKLEVEILFEDDQLIVFNKPPFMPVHPSVRHQGDTLGNFFSFHCKNLTFRPINRLDRDTSGCVIAAKNQFAASALQKTYEKTYYAICHGKFEKSEGAVDAPIAREKDSIIKRCVREGGQEAVTHYRVLQQSNEYSLLRLKLQNGRTHQIRVHMAYIGHPIAGDDMYGGSTKDYARQALHCGEIQFIHPTSGKLIKIQSPFELILR